MKKKLIIILIIIVIITGVVAGLLISRANKIIPQNPSNTVGNTAGNLYNGGYFCDAGDYVYFANAYDGYSLYRMKPDESKIEQLSAGSVKQINFAGKYLYFYQYDSNSGSATNSAIGSLINMYGIYRINVNKPKHNNVCLEKIRLDNMLLAGNSLYYDSNDGENVTFSELSLDGTTKNTILPYKITESCASGGKLYFHDTKDNFYLNSYDPNTKRVSVTMKEDVYMPIVDGYDVYYIDIHNGYALTRYNLSTGTKIVLDTERTDMYNLSGRYVYYQTAGSNPQFKRVAKNGGDMTVIRNGAHNCIQITSNYVYFSAFQSPTPVYKIPLDGAISITTFDNASIAAVENLKNKK